MNCPQCGTEAIPGALFCDNCGYDLSAVAPSQAAPPPAGPGPVPGGAPARDITPAPCPNCGSPAQPGAAFCDNCGASLQPAPAPPPASPAPLQPPPATDIPPASPAPVGTGNCPSCGQVVQPGAAFCDNCGAKLETGGPPSGEGWTEQPPVDSWPGQPPVTPTPAQPVLRMRLVVGGSGAQIPLAGKQEFLIGREDPISGVFPDADLTPHGGDVGGVSRQHARILVRGGQAFLEDLNSTNGTWVDKAKVQPAQPAPLNDGAEIRLGRVVLLFHTG